MLGPLRAQGPTAAAGSGHRGVYTWVVGRNDTGPQSTCKLERGWNAGGKPLGWRGSWHRTRKWPRWNGPFTGQAGGTEGWEGRECGAVDRALGLAVPCCVALAKRLSSLASVSLSRHEEGKVGLGW